MASQADQEAVLHFFGLWHDSWPEGGARTYARVYHTLEADRFPFHVDLGMAWHGRFKTGERLTVMVRCLDTGGHLFTELPPVVNPVPSRPTSGFVRSPNFMLPQPGNYVVTLLRADQPLAHYPLVVHLPGARGVFRCPAEHVPPLHLLAFVFCEEVIGIAETQGAECTIVKCFDQLAKTRFPGMLDLSVLVKLFGLGTADLGLRVWAPNRSCVFDSGPLTSTVSQAMLTRSIRIPDLPLSTPGNYVVELLLNGAAMAWRLLPVEQIAAFH